MPALRDKDFLPWATQEEPWYLFEDLLWRLRLLSLSAAAIAIRNSSASSKDELELLVVRLHEPSLLESLLDLLPDLLLRVDLAGAAFPFLDFFLDLSFLGDLWRFPLAS